MREPVVAQRKHIAPSMQALRVVLVGALIWTAPYQILFDVKLNEHSRYIGCSQGRST
ncbi:MAG: hypothetical protein ACC652_15180 [Acidimicrobiales bacterium]